MYAQKLTDFQADSLLNKIEKLAADTQKVNALYQLCTKLNRQHLPKKLSYFAQDALHIATQKNYAIGRGYALYIKGYIQFGNKNYNAAIDTIQQSQIILEANKDIIGSGRCHYTLSHIYYDMGQYQDVVAHAELALKQWKTISFNNLKCESYNDMALGYARMGNYSKAVEAAFKGYEAAELLNDKEGMAQSMHMVGSSFYEFNNNDNAHKYLSTAANLYIELKDSFGYARNNNMLGEIFLEQKNYTEAMKKFKESLAIYQRKDAPAWGEPWGYSNIGSVYEKLGDSLIEKKLKKEAQANYSLAIANYLESLKKFQAIKDPAGSNDQMILLGKTNFKANNLSLARYYILQSLNNAIISGEKKSLSSCYYYLSKLDSAEGNIVSAYKYYKKYVLYKDSIYNLQGYQALLAYKTEVDVAKKDHEITLLETENKLQKALSEKRSQGRNFAYLLAALFLASGIYGYFRFKKQSKLKAEQKMLKERLAISQDLHDSIGSTLSSIAVYSQVAKIHGEKNEQKDMNELLERISTASGETVVEMNDIVWALNPQNDSMEKILQRMESFAKPLATARNIHFNFVYETSLLHILLPMNIRKNLYLIFKEAINNSIKYSGAKELSVSLKQKEQMLELKISDNGIGFNTESVIKNKQSSMSGNGLTNLYKRAAEINGQLNIISSINNGTTVILLFLLTGK